MRIRKRRLYFTFGVLSSLIIFLHILGSDIALYGREAEWQSTSLPFIHSQSEGPTFARNRPPEAQSQAPSTSNADDSKKFGWEDLPIRHPVASQIPLPTGKPLKLPKIQYDFKAEDRKAKVVRLRRQSEVKKTFCRCWSSYKQNAWKMDELAPITGRGTESFGGWGATLIDSLDTLWIMEMNDEFEEAVATAAEVDFGPLSPLSDVINVFETNIRLLGGLLSAYDLSDDERLLEKAKEVGNMLYVAFDTPNRMLMTKWRPIPAATGKEQTASESVISAEIGSLSMEFTRLSQITGDGKWFDAIQRITNVFAEQQDQTQLPGMWPVVLNARDMNFTMGSMFTLGAMADSLYEYFPKMYALLGGQLPVYKKLYEGSIKAASESIFFRPMVPGNADILISGEVRTDVKPPELFPHGEHLSCFAGRMLALGGKLFDRGEHIEYGKKLTDGCVWVYKACPLGIMPESFQMLPCADPHDCTWNRDTWESAIFKKSGNWISDLDSAEAQETIANMHIPEGFTSIPDRRYILRPEAIESVFILYRITGDREYQDIAWDMFEAIEKNTKTILGNAGIASVITKEGEDVQLEDRMESFWLAETLKYFYLVFSEVDVISLDDWVSNTEAHPFRRPK
ncbi:glycosyl hydrolase [Tothia fuscella]|uniref:alpha-1,2-Mannosidase n=1 Tax=Tothia fuscella TaxID=1048955 RepID=A0A9P4TZ58_9PEZI|nr:glycosyl hydrolase [Tothia fuscella]